MFVITLHGNIYPNPRMKWKKIKLQNICTKTTLCISKDRYNKIVHGRLRFFTYIVCSLRQNTPTTLQTWKITMTKPACIFSHTLSNPLKFLPSFNIKLMSFSFPLNFTDSGIGCIGLFWTYVKILLSYSPYLTLALSQYLQWKVVSI